MEITKVYSKQSRRDSKSYSGALAKFIIEHMNERNMTNLKLCQMTGVTPSCLSDCFNGKRRFTTSAIVRIALGLDAFQMARIQSDEIVLEYIKSTFKIDSDEV